MNDLLVDVYLAPDGAHAGRRRVTDRLWVHLPVVRATTFCRLGGRSKGPALQRAAAIDHIGEYRAEIRPTEGRSRLPCFRGK